MNPLKPCPFCGGEAGTRAPNLYSRTCVVCKSCGISTRYDTPEAVKRQWNRRMPMEKDGAAHD